MSSAYVFTKPTELPALPRLPLLCMAGASGLNLLIERASEGDLPTCQALLNEVLAEGTTYPFEGPMDEAMFRAYFLSHEAFVAKDLAAGSKVCFCGAVSAVCFELDFELWAEEQFRSPWSSHSHSHSLTHTLSGEVPRPSLRASSWVPCGRRACCGMMRGLQATVQRGSSHVCALFSVFILFFSC